MPAGPTLKVHCTGGLLQPMMHTAKQFVKGPKLIGKAKTLPLVQTLLMLVANAAASAEALLPVGNPGTFVLPKLKQHARRIFQAQGVLFAVPCTWNKRHKNGPPTGGHVGNGGKGPSTRTTPQPWAHPTPPMRIVYVTPAVALNVRKELGPPGHGPFGPASSLQATRLSEPHAPV